ncbi:MAG: O-antigen ligase family protein [Desulfobulbaceae bacterium]
MTVSPDHKLQQYAFSLLALAVFAVFTGYVFLNARLEDTVGDLVLLFLLFLAIPRLSVEDFHRNGKFFVALFWTFLALTLGSVLFPPSQFAKLYWLVIALYRLLFSAIIVFALFNRSDQDRPVLRWGLTALCLLLAVLYICEQQGLNIQEALKGLSPLRLDQSPWHDKNYAFWQLLLMWGSISLLWQRSRSCTAIAAVVFLVSVAAILFSTSESSMLALAISSTVFLFANRVRSKGRYPLYFCLIMSVVLLPLLWVCLAPLKPLFADILPQMEGITTRVELFDYTASLIRKELVLGYGFGSTIFMPIPQGEVGWQFCFPGGHTHNLILQFFIDHGLLGLVFIAAVLALFFHYLHHTLEDNPQAPAIWALVMAGLVLFSLSYATWHADSVLMYCMWFALILAATSRHGRPAATWLASSRPAMACIFFGILAVACYSVDYLFLAD